VKEAHERETHLRQQQFCSRRGDFLSPMSRFWVGDKPSTDTLAALVPETVQRKLETRRRSRSPRKEPPKKPAGPPGGTSKLETLPTELRTQLFAYDGYNLIRELVSLLSASRTCRDTVGAGPRAMIASVLPALRAWRIIASERVGVGAARVRCDHVEREVGRVLM